MSEAIEQRLKTLGAGFTGGNLSVEVADQDSAETAVATQELQDFGPGRYFYSITPAITGSGGYFASVAQPRTFGATLRASF